MKKNIISLYSLILLGTCLLIASCSSEETETLSNNVNFDNLKFIVNVNKGNSRGASFKRDWEVGDKIVAAIDNNDNNLCNLEYEGNGEWSVTRNNDQTEFAKDEGNLSAVHADRLYVEADKIVTGGDVLYTQEGTYTRHGNVVEINLNMNNRPVSRIAVVGLDISCWIENLEEYSRLQSLSSMRWNTNYSSEGMLNREIYGDTCVFYGILNPDENGNTTISIINSYGAKYSRTYADKIIGKGEYVIVKGPESLESDMWSSHVPVIGIKAVSSSITMMEGEKKDSKELYVISPKRPTNANVAIASSEPDTVKVDADGFIEALKRGQANITITTDDGNYECVVKVTVQNIIDFIDMQVTGISKVVSPWGIASSVDIKISNNSNQTVHLVTLGGASIDEDLAGKANKSYTLSNRYRDISEDNFELVFTSDGKTYTKTLK